MENKDVKILGVIRGLEDEITININTEMAEEEVLAGYTMLTHALAVFFASRYEDKYRGNSDKAITEAWIKLDYASDLAREYNDELLEDMEVTRP